jgi:hypothetical protein
MEHLMNCHGEWAYLASALGSLPFVGMYVRAWRVRRKERKCCERT